MLEKLLYEHHSVVWTSDIKKRKWKFINGNKSEMKIKNRNIKNRKWWKRLDHLVNQHKGQLSYLNMLNPFNCIYSIIEVKMITNVLDKNKMCSLFSISCWVCHSFNFDSSVQFNCKKITQFKWLLIWTSEIASESCLNKKYFLSNFWWFTLKVSLLMFQVFSLMDFMLSEFYMFI